MLHKIYLVLAAITRMVGMGLMLSGVYMTLLSAMSGLPSAIGFVPLALCAMIIFSAKTIARFAVAGLD